MIHYEQMHAEENAGRFPGRRKVFPDGNIKVH
jgi:hypothetical protein